jgi:DNA-binding NarL/FixJ family response regulator
MYRSRILIADDHTLVAELCKMLLETDFDVVGTVKDG